MVRPHLVESKYCKILGPLKGMFSLTHFPHKKYFSIVAAIQKKVSKILKITNISKGNRQSDLRENGVI